MLLQAHILAVVVEVLALCTEGAGHLVGSKFLKIPAVVGHKVFQMSKRTSEHRIGIFRGGEEVIWSDLGVKFLIKIA
ncbi:hypothetical protein IMSAG192_01600 [Muribaculaceae bacterium]|nr:hypothetical protein IMSAG192_01600 [Muribaculaceae bacterium]